ncbi:MAG: hypothetical protein NZZ41_06230, partial [Candidatus Dojkabacteria bacterium]|nr:hypothetical protein [Candidatus Dojkabacteria bacterium]
MENGFYLDKNENIENSEEYYIDLWKVFIENLKSRGIQVPENYKNVEQFFASDNDDIFDNYMKTSIKSILVKMTNLMHKAITKFEKGMENLDEKSIFVIMDKLTSQIKILNEMYNKSTE